MIFNKYLVNSIGKYLILQLNEQKIISFPKLVQYNGEWFRNNSKKFCSFESETRSKKFQYLLQKNS